MPCITAVDIESILCPTYVAPGFTPVYMKNQRDRLMFQLCEDEDSPLVCTQQPEFGDIFNVPSCGVFLDPRVHHSIYNKLESVETLVEDKYAWANHERIVHSSLRSEPVSIRDGGWVFFVVNRSTVIYRMTIGGCVALADETYLTKGVYLVPHVFALYRQDPYLCSGIDLRADVVLVIPRAVQRWRILRRFVSVRRYVLRWLLHCANASEERRIVRAKLGNVDDPLA